VNESCSPSVRKNFGFLEVLILVLSFGKFETVSENQHLGWPSNEHKLIHIIELKLFPPIPAAYSLSTKMYSEQHATQIYPINPINHV